MTRPPEPGARPGPSVDAGIEPWSPDPASSPPPDPDRVPEGFVVVADGGVKLHFHDWGAPAAVDRARPGVLLIPGLLQPAWSWAPVARRLAGACRTVVTDLRGHGLSDAPMEGYDLGTLAADAVAVAEGSGALAMEAGDAGGRPGSDGTSGGRPRVVLAGHGFGAIVAATAAAALGSRCAGLVLVDGGWERLEETTGLDVDDMLRGLDEPPEVMRSMAAWLGDRRAFDPATWDADQERIALDSIVETAAGHVVRAVRPHVVEAVVRTMFGYDPASVLARVGAPVTALVAMAGGETGARLAELRRAADARRDAGLSPIRVAGFHDAHNLMRYRPAELAASILAVGG